MIKLIVKFIAALNGNLGKDQIAAGFAWGLILGLIPAGNIFWIVFFIFSFFFKHHHWSKLLFMTVVKLFLGAINPLLDIAGWEILHIAAMQPFYTMLFNMPLMPLTGFNNTLVAGALVCGPLLWFPVFFLARLLVPLFRKTFIPKIRENKIVKAILKFPLFAILDKAVKAAS